LFCNIIISIFLIQFVDKQKNKKKQLYAVQVGDKYKLKFDGVLTPPSAYAATSPTGEVWCTSAGLTQTYSTSKLYGRTAIAPLAGKARRVGEPP
jgi:hypothetical protein